MRPPDEPRWVDRLVVDAVHFDLVREHGGMPGVRDDDALEAALSRPRHRWAYGTSDLAALAAGYGFTLVSDHPYNDGNKRTAFVTMGVFLGLNGFRIEASEEEVVATMFELAAGKLGEDVLTSWVSTHLLER